MLELHMAHGYLLASYLSPLNQSTHRHVWRLPSRIVLRFPLEVLADRPGAMARGQTPVGAHFRRPTGWTAASATRML